MMISPTRHGDHWEWEELEVKSCKSSNTLGVFAKKKVPAGSFFLVLGRGLPTWRTAKLQVHYFIRHNKEIDRRCDVRTVDTNCEFVSMLLSDLLTDDVLKLGWVQENIALIQSSVAAPVAVMNLVEMRALPVYVCRVTRDVDAGVELRWDYNKFNDLIMAGRPREAYIDTTKIVIKKDQLKMFKPVHVCKSDYKWVIDEEDEESECCNLTMFTWRLTDEFMSSFTSYGLAAESTMDMRLRGVMDRLFQVYCGVDVHVFDDDARRRPVVERSIDYIDIASLRNVLIDLKIRPLFLTVDGVLRSAYQQFDCFISVFEDREEAIRDSMQLMLQLDPNQTAVFKHIYARITAHYDERIAEYKQQSAWSDRDYDRMISYINRKVYPVSLAENAKLLGAYQYVWSDIMFDVNVDRKYDRNLELSVLYITKEEWNARAAGAEFDFDKSSDMNTWLRRLEAAKNDFKTRAEEKRAQIRKDVEKLVSVRKLIKPITYNEDKCASYKQQWALYAKLDGGVFCSTKLYSRTRLLVLPVVGGLGIATRIRSTDDYTVNNCANTDPPEPAILLELLLNNAWANSASSHQCIRNEVVEMLKTRLKSCDNVDERLLLTYQTKTPTLNNLIKASGTYQIDLRLRTIMLTRDVNQGNELLLLSDVGKEGKRLDDERRRQEVQEPRVQEVQEPRVQEPRVQEQPRMDTEFVSSNFDLSDNEYPIPLPPVERPIDDPTKTPIENAYNRVVYAFWNQTGDMIKDFDAIKQDIILGPGVYDKKPYSYYDIRKDIKNIIDMLKKVPVGTAVTVDMLAANINVKKLLSLLLADKANIVGKTVQDVIQRYERLLHRMVSYNMYNIDPKSFKMPAAKSVIKKRMTFYSNLRQTTFSAQLISDIAARYTDAYNAITAALLENRGDGDSDSEREQQPLKRLKKMAEPEVELVAEPEVELVAEPEAEPEVELVAEPRPMPVSRLVTILVSQQCLEQFRELANQNYGIVNGVSTLVELGARLCMNKETNIIDKLVIPPQIADTTSWTETDTKDVGANHTRFGQIHSHVSAFTCFLSKTDIINQRLTQRIEAANAIMIIYSQNCGGPSTNVEGRLGTVQLDLGEPSHDGFKAYTLRPAILDMSQDEFADFINNRYDEQSAEQRVYMAANWQVVNVPGVVEDLRLGMSIDGGTRAMKSVLRELAMS